MNNKKTAYKYVKPMDAEKVARRRKRLPQYDECLREFLESGSKAWKVNLKELPSQEPRRVLSSLKWRRCPKDLESDVREPHRLR